MFFFCSLAGHYIDNIETLHFYTGSKFALRALSEGLRQELQAANSGIKLSVSLEMFDIIELCNRKVIITHTPTYTPEKYKNDRNITCFLVCVGY